MGGLGLKNKNFPKLITMNVKSTYEALQDTKEVFSVIVNI